MALLPRTAYDLLSLVTLAGAFAAYASYLYGSARVDDRRPEDRLRLLWISLTLWGLFVALTVLSFIVILR